MVRNYCTCDTVLQNVSVMTYYTKEELKVKKYITCTARYKRLKDVYYCPKCEIFVKLSSR